ncbi:hypothetical protein DFH09DRAFT_295216 [Mycena vulgaris]|nr:hypothetical protein DFH09DRAFT_295216 [Mycena vulgaris]
MENTWGPTEEESQLVVQLCEAVDFAKDILWLGTDDTRNDFVRALEDLWQTAAHIGYSHGLEHAVPAPLDEAEDELAQERVLAEDRIWASDIGQKLWEQQRRAHVSRIWRDMASQPATVATVQMECADIPHADVPPRSPSVAPVEPARRSLSDPATETETMTPAPVAATAAIVPAVPVPLNWAEDAACLPTLPLQAESPPSTPRDFSALITGSPQPFGSLQRCRRRSPRPPTSSSLQNHSPQKHSIRRPQKKSTICAAPRHSTPSYSHPPPSIAFRTPTSFPPSDKPASQFPLDWDQDPRLRDLSHALTALGWIRAGGGA